MKKIIISLLMVNILLFNCLLNNCYAAAVPVTKEKLEESLQKFVNDNVDPNLDIFKIFVDNNIITITDSEGSHELKYDLTKKPTFTSEALIKQGMSYEEYLQQVNQLFLVEYAYLAVANIQGAEVDDIVTYFTMSFLGRALAGGHPLSTENAYLIIDDSNGKKIDNDSVNQNVIYTSEFGDRVMEMVNNMFKEKLTFKDDINSFECTTERKDVNEKSCKLVTTLSVNPNADFSQLRGFSNKAFLNADITKENADYAITLKVGQKCRIETDEKLTGNMLYGGICEYKTINKNCAEITAKSVGEANGYIYFGNTKKSIFITIEENKEDASLDTKILKINTIPEKDQEDTNHEKQEKQSDINNNQQQEKSTINSNSNNKNSVSTDRTTAKTILPKTGSNGIIFTLMFFTICLVIMLKVKLKEYNDIK